MPGIVELPTLEELKVEEVRLSLREGGRPGAAAAAKVARARSRPLRPARSHPASSPNTQAPTYESPPVNRVTLSDIT